MGVDPNELDAIIEKAGLGERSAKKLREANGAPKSEKKSSPRGHGAPALPHRMAGTL